MAKLKSASKLKKSDSTSIDPRSRSSLNPRQEVSLTKKSKNKNIRSATNVHLKSPYSSSNSLENVARNIPDAFLLPFRVEESVNCTYESILHDQIIQLEKFLIRIQAACTAHDTDEILSSVGARAKVFQLHFT